MKKKEEFPEPNYAQTIALHLCKCYEGIGGINLCCNDEAYCYDGNPVEDIDGKFSTFVLKDENGVEARVRVTYYELSESCWAEITFSCEDVKVAEELAIKLRYFIKRGKFDGNPTSYFLTMFPYQTKPIVRVMY